MQACSETLHMRRVDRVRWRVLGRDDGTCWSLELALSACRQAAGKYCRPSSSAVCPSGIPETLEQVPGAMDDAWMELMQPVSVKVGCLEPGQAKACAVTLDLNLTFLGALNWILPQWLRLSFLRVSSVHYCTGNIRAFSILLN